MQSSVCGHAVHVVDVVSPQDHAYGRIMPGVERRRHAELEIVSAHRLTGPAAEEHQ